MALLVQPRLVNGPFSDSGLLLDFRFGSRAMLFDIGDLSALSSREILRVSHVFVSHRHMDHFAGFDQLLRLCLYRDIQVRIVGPPGLADAVEAKLRAYDWNLLGKESHDFAIEASDWTPRGFCRRSLFRARAAFARQDLPLEDLGTGRVLEEPEFEVQAAALDHGIPSLAFALQEAIRVNVHKARLDQLGLPVGPWLTEAKRAIRCGDDPATTVSPLPDRPMRLADLVQAGALKTGRGQRIVYATDLAFHQANVERLLELASGADQLFIEAGFLEEDRELAASKKHLTAAQAGRIARLAGVRRAMPMHFSPRYMGREAELIGEFEAAFQASTPIPEAVAMN